MRKKKTINFNEYDKFTNKDKDKTFIVAEDEDKYKFFNSIKKIEKEYYIGTVRGIGSWLFFSLSYITFRTEAYLNQIRSSIWD